MFDTLKKKVTGIFGQLAGIKAEFEKLNDDIAAHEMEIERLTTAPLCRADVVAKVSEMTKAASATYSLQLGQLVERLNRRPLDTDRHHALGVLRANRGDTNNIECFETALLAVFKEPIERAIVEHINATPWPENAGPPVIERREALINLQRELAELIELRNTMRSEAADAGILI